ncbi:hypothetical protein LO772_21865 [Yinghuangia sp. ASG 101]|uniref:DUF6912 family protein n=1 Tax=Yinghuangia sp. ASG 101 TaxID=2896848 RepID=UPI001E473D02|nr:hypothetical protein [Yinghuangia sp. ASG 101]UGQ09567.1 hypothetical protein LO772_21865 [Yinghuangia sp. ASG 101]
MRVYIPSTPTALAGVQRENGVGPAPVGAWAVTAGLRVWCGTDNDEELEYAATVLAGRASLALIAGASEGPPRRVVLVAEVPDTIVREDAGLGPGAVSVGGTIPLKRVAAVHLDAAEAEDAVRAALGVLDAADAGDEAAEALVEAVEEHELLWFATQELPGLVAAVDSA